MKSCVIYAFFYANIKLRSPYICEEELICIKKSLYVLKSSYMCKEVNICLKLSNVCKEVLICIYVL